MHLFLFYRTTTATTFTTPTTTSTPAAIATITPTPGAMPAAFAAAARTASAAVALGKLRCYQCGRRMSTIFYDHCSVCFDPWVVVPTFVERSCFDF